MYFSLDKELNKLTIDPEVLVDIPEFAKLMRRIRPMKGDSDGKEKKLNFKEMMYVFYMAEWTNKNILAGLPSIKRHKEAVKLCDFPDNWEPDDAVKKGIAKYEWIQQELSPTGRVLIAAKRNLMQMALQFEVMNKQNEMTMRILEGIMDRVAEYAEQDSSDVVLDESFLKTLTDLNATTEVLQSNMLRTATNVKTIEDSLKRLETLEKSMTQELTANAAIYGGRILSKRENPDKRKRESWIKN